MAVATIAFAQSFLLIENSDHFNIRIRNDLLISIEEKEALITTLETGYAKVSAALAGYSVPPQKLEVRLNGEGLPPNGAPNYPNVDDSTGVITLYKFPGPGEAYLQGLPHEIVHAFRIDMIRHHERLGDFFKGYLFIEEAFAEYISTKIEPNNISFPRYGIPLDVAAGYWIARKQDIPIEILFDHHQLNATCVAQAYPLRASFFQFLAQQYGEKRLFELAYARNAITKEIFDRIFGKNLQQLSSDWKSWAMTKFMETPDKNKKLQEFCMTDMPYFPVCSIGQSWSDPKVSFGTSDSKDLCLRAVEMF